MESEGDISHIKKERRRDRGRGEDGQDCTGCLDAALRGVLVGVTDGMNDGQEEEVECLGAALDRQDARWDDIRQTGDDEELRRHAPILQTHVCLPMGG